MGARDRIAKLISDGIKAFHSSPHDFDKFDASKIGTGEGAQSYGHGLYFAENPKVSGQGGQYWNSFLRRFDYPERGAAEMLKEHGFDRQKAIEASKWNIDQFKDAMPPKMSQEERNYLRTLLMAREAEHAALTSGKPIGPRTYEVNINARPEQFLDWDKPLSAQSSHVREALPDIVAREAEYKARYPHSPMGDPFGSNIYDQLGIQFHQPGRGHLDRAVVSSALSERGIPGIKYLDQGSRGMGGGMTSAGMKLDVPPPTSNYVVFDPGIVDIMKKYAVPGAIGAGAIGSTFAQDQYEASQ